MNNHPIIPPPELVEQWWDAVPGTFTHLADEMQLATAAAQWGADQELEATLGLMETLNIRGVDYIRNVRRPEPPRSLKEQALKQLDEISTCFRVTHMGDIVCDKIREALEAL
jgi:hypothetical protein